MVAYLVPEEESAGVRGKGDGARGLEEFLAEKVHGLRGIVLDVRSEIDRRARVSHEVAARICEQYLYLKTKLFELYRWPLSANRAMEQRRLGVEGMLDLLLREHRNEQVKCTEEIARLKGELWRWLREYLELAQRVQLVLDGGKRYEGR
ncbi:MAG: hypothetical protein ABL962_14800 [Fimbriimonadaceae bacterium]